MELTRCFFTLSMLIAVKTTLGDSVQNVSVHVLDPHVRKPAIGIKVTLHKLDESYQETFVTLELLIPMVECRSLRRQNTKEYFTSKGRITFYPFVDIVFEVEDADVHHHVPLLLNAYSYTTYRGIMRSNLKGNTETKN